MMSKHRVVIDKYMNDIDQQLELMLREHEKVVKALKNQIEQLEAQNSLLKMYVPKNPYLFPDTWEITFTDPVTFAVPPSSGILKFALKDGDKYVFPDPNFKITLKEE